MTLETRSLPNLSRYLFREDGEVLTKRMRDEPRALAGGVDKDGYRKFVLINDAGQREYHRRSTLICRAFHGERPLNKEVRHLDGSRTNDAASNLEWATHRENIADKLIHGTVQRGANNWRSRLTEADVVFIREHPDIPATVLSEWLNASVNSIYAAREGRSWAWVAS